MAPTTLTIIISICSMIVTNSMQKVHPHQMDPWCLQTGPQWNQAIHNLHLKLSATHNVNQMFDLISNVSQIIRRHYKYSLNKYHTKSMLHFYSITLKKMMHTKLQREDSISSQSIIKLIKTMMRQNIKLDINLDVFLWYQCFSLCYPSPTIESINSILDKISNLSALIQESPFNSSAFEIALSQSYTLFIKKRDFKLQKQLVSLIERMTQQSSEFGVKLHLSVWNIFFYKFYRSFKHIEDHDIFCLLGKMQTKPDLNTFNIILNEIAIHPGINDAVHLIDIIINNVMMELHKITPDATSYRIQFRVCLEKGNIKTITHLMIHHPNITFIAPNIQIFNQMLLDLPNINYGEKCGQYLKIIINEIMPKYNVKPNMDTYQILMKLYRKYSDLIDNLKIVFQRNDDRFSMYHIGKRIQRIRNKLKSTETAKEAMEVISDLIHFNEEQYPFNRNNLTIYQSLISSVYLNIIKKLTMLSQTELVELMKLMMVQNKIIGINLDISAWNEFFKMYYLKQSQYPNNYILKWLRWMQLKGSNIKPDVYTLNLILNCISTNDYIQDPNELMDVIINFVWNKYKIKRNEESYQLQFRVFNKTQNIKGITDLIIHHQNIIFIHVNIMTFNHILAELPNYGGNFCQNVQVIINEIMPRYGIVADLNTHLILYKLCLYNPSCAGLNIWNYRLLFQVCTIKRDIKAAAFLVITKTDIFNSADIHVFNNMLADLPNHSDDFRNILRFILNGAMSKYNIKPNMETYNILAAICTKYPEIEHDLKMFSQPNLNHSTVFSIVKGVQQSQDNT